MTDTAYVSTLPQCDITDCTDLASYDSATIYGPWAYLCDNHWLELSPKRLGLGYGQKLLVK